MPQTQTMTLDEKLAIGIKAAELRKAGDEEGALRLMKTAPIPSYSKSDQGKSRRGFSHKRGLEFSGSRG